MSNFIYRLATVKILILKDDNAITALKLLYLNKDGKRD